MQPFAAKTRGVDIVNLPDEVKRPILLMFVSTALPREGTPGRMIGDVVFDGVVDPDGKLRDLEMRQTGPWSAQMPMGYADCALFAMQGWRFFPGLRNGVPVPVKLTVLVRR